MPAHKLLKSGKSDLARRKNELWYRRRLTVVGEDAKQAVVPALKDYYATLPSSKDEVDASSRAAVHAETQRIIATGKAKFTMPIDPHRTARFAAAMNQQSTDVWWAQQMRAQKIPIQPAHLPKPRMLDATPAQFADATAQRLSKAQLAALKAARARAGLALSPVHGLGTLSTIAGQPEIEQAFYEQVANNVALITSIPPQYFDRLEENLFDAMESGQHWEAFAGALLDGIAQTNNLLDYRVALIARDQTSKMSAAFNEARSASVGISEYTWQTAGDERVRQSHADNDGQLFSFDEGAPIDDDGTLGNPGDAVNCRCVAIPYVEEADDDAEVAA